MYLNNIHCVWVRLTINDFCSTVYPCVTTAYTLFIIHWLTFSCTSHVFAGLLHNIFYYLYDTETIKETTFFDWLKRGAEDTGRSVALQSVKGFFDWLENAKPESDNESGT